MTLNLDLGNGIHLVNVELKYDVKFGILDVLKSDLLVTSIYKKEHRLVFDDYYKDNYWYKVAPR